MSNWNILSYKNRNIIDEFQNIIVLQLISISGCDSKSWTISVCPLSEATSKGVQWNIKNQYRKVSSL